MCDNYKERNQIAINNPFIEDWIKIGKKNHWINNAWDPEFNKASFYECLTIDELKEKFLHGNWTIGTAFVYKNFCFINQVDGGDEFLTIRNNIEFESISAGYMIRHNNFDSFMERVIKAQDGELRMLNY